MNKIIEEFRSIFATLRAVFWPNTLRPTHYHRRHRYTRRTPLGLYACELCYRYRLEHPTAGIFGRYTGAGAPLALPNGA